MSKLNEIKFGSICENLQGEYGLVLDRSTVRNNWSNVEVCLVMYDDEYFDDVNIADLTFIKQPLDDDTQELSQNWKLLCTTVVKILKKV